MGEKPSIHVCRTIGHDEKRSSVPNERNDFSLMERSPQAVLTLENKSCLVNFGATFNSDLEICRHFSLSKMEDGIKLYLIVQGYMCVVQSSGAGSSLGTALSILHPLYGNFLFFYFEREKRDS
jgi:hypothetical protein